MTVGEPVREHPTPVPEPERLGGRYWRFLSASALSNLADGIVKVGLPLVAVAYTRSPALVAGVAIAFSLPWLLFALPAGALADRFDRRRAMLAANTLRAVLVGLLAVAVALDVGSIWLVYVVAFAVGVTETLHDTAGQSILPQLVARELLPQANGRLGAVERTANAFIGPPLAGFLCAGGVAVALAGPAGLWALAVVAMLFVGGRFRVERDTTTSLRADIAEGLRFLWRHRLLRTLALMVGGSNFTTSAAFERAGALRGRPGLRDGAHRARVRAAPDRLAAGIVVGALTATRRAAARPGVDAAGALAAWAGLIGVPALTTNPYVIGGVFFGSGVLAAAWDVSPCRCASGSPRTACSGGSTAATGCLPGAACRSAPPPAGCWRSSSGSVRSSPSWVWRRSPAVRHAPGHRCRHRRRRTRSGQASSPLTVGCRI